MKHLLAISIVLASVNLNAQDLEHKIKLVAIAHHLDPETFRAILVTESHLKLGAINQHSHDYGIGQLNIRTIEALGLDKARLLTDLDYSLNESAKVLHTLCRYNASECVGRYNVGTGPLTGKRALNYAIYVEKVRKNKRKRYVAGGY